MESVEIVLHSNSIECKYLLRCPGVPPFAFEKEEEANLAKAMIELLLINNLSTQHLDNQIKYVFRILGIKSVLDRIIIKRNNYGKRILYS